jgi:hypothetical protein
MRTPMSREQLFVASIVKETVAREGPFSPSGVRMLERLERVDELPGAFPISFLVAYTLFLLLLDYFTLLDWDHQFLHYRLALVPSLEEFGQEVAHLNLFQGDPNLGKLRADMTHDFVFRVNQLSLSPPPVPSAVLHGQRLLCATRCAFDAYHRCICKDHASHVSLPGRLATFAFLRSPGRTSVHEGGTVKIHITHGMLPYLQLTRVDPPPTATGATAAPTWRLESQPRSHLQFVLTFSNACVRGVNTSQLVASPEKALLDWTHASSVCCSPFACSSLCL